jgi:hypothetical protein
VDGLWSNYSVCRANDVANANALVVCTTSVTPASSACSGIETVPSARQSGMATNGLVRKRSPRQRNIFEARGEVVVAEEDSKRLRKRRTRVTKAEKPRVPQEQTKTITCTYKRKSHFRCRFFRDPNFPVVGKYRDGCPALLRRDSQQ